MIQVVIHRNSSGLIVAYDVSGHAEYAESGKDIVCAGVSAVAVGTVNALQELLPIQLEHRMKNGLLSVKLPRIEQTELSENVSDHAQLLLESMLVMLRTIEHSYGQYIKIREKHANQ